MTQSYKIVGSKEIPLTRGMSAIVDAEDYDKVIQYGKWHVVGRGAHCYAGRDLYKGGPVLYMHRLLMGNPSPEYGLRVDHINHNRLDNRKTNLRIITHGMNMFNRKQAQPNSRSGINGVYWSKQKQKWYIEWRGGGGILKRMYRSFATLEEAVAARKELETEIWKAYNNVKLEVKT